MSSAASTSSRNRGFRKLIPRLRLGARGSMLSLLQSRLVARALEIAHPGLKVNVVTVSTTGDHIQDRPLHELGGKGLFTKQIEQALLDGAIDFAVHSFKDVPVTMPLVDATRLIIAATPEREDPRDALVSIKSKTILDLPVAAKVGTGSLRRQAQLLALRPDLHVSLIRGNVDTRIWKLRTNEFDAVILAMAGLKRSGLFDPSFMSPIPVDQLLPSAGQGALAIQCRNTALDVLNLLDSLNHPDTGLCVALEREVIRLLNGDCHSPIAAFATIIGDKITMEAAVARRDGRPPVIKATVTVDRNAAAAASKHVVAKLMDQGALALLNA